MRATWKGITATAAAAAISASLCLPASVAAAPTDNAVFVGGTMIMRVRVGGGGYTPEQRATQIQERVNRILSSGPVMASDITVGQWQGETAVLVKGRLLFTADWQTARFNRTTPQLLAEQWAERMRGVLPTLTAAK